MRVQVPSLAHSLGAIAAELRTRYRGIAGVGFGFRHCDRKQDLSSERVLKVLVKEKLRPLPKHIARLPKHLQLVSRVFGQKIEVKVGVDVAQMPKAEPTWLRVMPANGGVMTAAAYATWTSANGRPQIGVVTAGHGLWRDSATPRRTARIRLGQGPSATEVRANVVAASKYTDGVDVGLLRLDPRDRGDAPKLRSGSFEIALDLAARLGDPQDHLASGATFETENVIETIETIAFYESVTLNVTGWDQVKMRDVIESQDSGPSFVGGTSGAAIVDAQSGTALGIQSLCLDPGTNQRSLATSFLSARAWLRENVSPNLELQWKLG